MIAEKGLLATWRASTGLAVARRSDRACALSRTAFGLAKSIVEGAGLAVVTGCRAGLFIRMRDIDCGWVDVVGAVRRAGLFIRMLVDCDGVDAEG